MLFSVTHVKRYVYSAPVFLEPMTLRLRPRDDVTQRLLAHELRLFPEPAGRSEVLEFDGHSATQLWFTGLQDSFEIVCRSRAETFRVNPFDFLLAPAALTLPLVYPRPLAGCLQAYQMPACRAAAVERFSSDIARKARFQTLEFLNLLSATIAGQFEREIRQEGPPRASDETLELGLGACRDFTVLFNDCCRLQGIAARFVSGYCATDSEPGEEIDLHAWSEVYLPSAGWRGYDPAQGLAVSDQHLALCASIDATEAAASAGHYRGDASCRLEATVTLEARETVEGEEPLVDEQAIPTRP